MAEVIKLLPRDRLMLLFQLNHWLPIPLLLPISLPSVLKWEPIIRILLE